LYLGWYFGDMIIGICIFYYFLYMFVLIKLSVINLYFDIIKSLKY